MDEIDDEHTCGKCHEKFNTFMSFLLHKLKHMEARKGTSCPLCHVAFSRQVALREHLHRKHNVSFGEINKPVKCRPLGRPRKVSLDFVVENSENSQGMTIVSADDSHLPLMGYCAETNCVQVVIDKIDVCDSSLASPIEKSHVIHKTDNFQLCGSSPIVSANIIDNRQLPINAQTDIFNQNELTDKVKVCERIECPEIPKADISTDLANSQEISLLSSISVNQITSASSSVQNCTEMDLNVDFLFILLTNHIKGNSFNYSKLGFKCFHCDYRTSWRNSLVRHMHDKHPEMLAVHQCISIHNPETAENHQVMKMSDYTALQMRQRKLTKTLRIRGAESQDLIGSYSCGKCDKVFARLRYLRKHQVIHKADKKHLCAECGKAFKTKAYLAAHQRTHSTVTKMYKCSQCDFTSSINALIHSHRQLHNDGSVLCDVCGWAYTDRATLKKHKRVHDKNRPYPCTYPECTWRFKTEVMCRAHFRGHTTLGRFVCSICSYVFRHKHHLQRHLTRMHGMDETTVYRATCGQHNPNSSKVRVIGIEKKNMAETVGDQELQIAETVNLIVNSDLSTEQLQSVLESGQLVIATDGGDSTVNYEVADITMNVAYHALMESEEVVPGAQAILIPQSGECSEIILKQEFESEPTVVET